MCLLLHAHVWEERKIECPNRWVDGCLCACMPTRVHTQLGLCVYEHNAGLVGMRVCACMRS